MVDATMTGVLADVAALVLVALVLGAGIYQGLRVLRLRVGVVAEGKVPAQDYRAADAVVVLVLAWMLWAGLRSIAGGEVADGTVVEEVKAATEAAVSGGGVVDVLANVLFLLLVCMGLLFYLRQVRDLDPAALFGLRRVSLGRVLGYGLLGLIGVLPVVLVVSAGYTGWLQGYWPDLQPQDAVKMFVESEGWAGKALMAGAAVIVAPLVEETVFRGFVYGVLKRYSDSWFAAILSAAMFALAHFHLGSAVPLFVLALGFSWAYERTGSLLVPMVMHALFNATTLVVLLFFGGEA
jgi:membrane protease YdiL (CAAX protease family)